ncbi:hypothetical protein [Actinokineospora sp. NBRC 105648]|uniref:hypothetical protein n=1 Tax=Actinokineospora sp. NBRC 105648 TaxID=3032206 RepID=UPI0024A229FD|nr:hypothetical protein [Actinokineospora sp. NBRC 105648]GLZ37769.1 hypothetical protein Acsp05_13940 [Actinokineospora sp. NBRC 105648]
MALPRDPDPAEYSDWASVKLNSADSQRGGFTEDESLDVVRALGEAGLDLLSGTGTAARSCRKTGVRLTDSWVEIQWHPRQTRRPAPRRAAVAGHRGHRRSAPRPAPGPRLTQG